MGEELAGYLTDESSFYGDDDVKASFEARVEAFDEIEQSWILKKSSPSITEIAELNIAKRMATEKTKKVIQHYNPYRGLRCARQLEETVDKFLARLPPESTRVSDDLSWIWIANPFALRPNIDAEAGYGADKWSHFEILGQNLLEELTDDLADIAKDMAEQPQLKITRAQNQRRDAAVAKLKDMATEMKCTSGKWLLFVSPLDVNETWAVIARATALGDLGMASKVAPDCGNERRNDRVICIYTEDFTNLEDVKRVATKLKDLRCIDARRAIYYKADMYTHLCIESGNEWNIKSSLYASTDILGSQRKMDGFLKRKQ